MMKIKKIFLQVLFAFILASSVVHAEEGDVSIGAVIGESGLVGDGMGAYGVNGFGYGGFVSYGVSYMFDLDMNFVYAPHSSGNNKANSFYFTPALKFLFSYEPLIPFVTMGVGFYKNSITNSTITGSTTSFGFNFGGGVDVKLSKYLLMGVLVRYHTVFDKDIAVGVPGVKDVWDALFRIGVNFSSGTTSGWD